MKNGFLSRSVLALAGLAAGLATATPAQAEIEWNGFGSGYYGQSLKNDILPYGFTDQYGDFTAFSLLGLNLSSKMSDELSAAAQIVAQSNTPNENWGLVAKWGYLTYSPSNSFSFKVGRQLYPIFFESEFSSVGFLLPYRAVPGALQNVLPFPAFDGVAAIYKTDTGIGRLRLNLFGGTGNLNLSKFSGVGTVSGSVHDVIGLAADLDGDGWGVHAAYSRNRHDLSIATGFGALDFKENVENFSVGYRLEKFNIVNWAEYFYQRNTEDRPALNMARAGYVLLGYRLGAFLPRYMFVHQQANIVPVFPGQAQNNHVIGLNYQLSPQAVLKAEYEMGKVADGYGPASASRAQTSTATDIQAVYAGIDFIF